MKGVCTVDLPLVQPLLHHKMATPLAVASPAARSPEWDIYRRPRWTPSLKQSHPCMPGPPCWASLDLHTLIREAKCCLLWLRDLGVFVTQQSLMTSFPCWRRATHVMEGSREVCDLCSRTTVNPYSLLIPSAFGQKQNHYMVTQEILRFTWEVTPGCPIIIS